MVLKPSRLAPLNAFILAEIMEQVGVPPGVFNLVCGSGPVVGNAITTHTDVDMLSLTGSTASGVRVAQAGALTIKRVTLELGGKSANILLDDADFEFAVPEGVNNCFLNSGQTCSALTRMLVPADRQSEVVDLARSEAESLVIGDAFDDETFIGPLVDAEQQRSVREYIRKGISEGATLVTGGPEPVDGLGKGFYVKPTIFADVTAKMTIAREEIFGPVLCIIPYKTEAEAIQIANDSIYGLSGSVWSADPERAKQVARQIRTGQVFINGAGFDVHAPFGGYKQSGNGRERSKYGLEEFLEIKAIMGYHPVL
jgi:acyl-CoA reductase-like NAD-dependent aldehyde dehydrogenase